MNKYEVISNKIKAIRWNGKNVKEVYNFLEDKEVQTQYEVKTEGKNFYIDFKKAISCELGNLIMKTLDGDVKADIGDYIIKEIDGTYHTCKPNIFEKIYKKAN